MNRNPKRMGIAYRIATALFFSLLFQHLSAQTSGNFTTVSASNGNTTGARQNPLNLGNWASPTTTFGYQTFTTDGGTSSLEIHAQREGSNFLLTRSDAGNAVFNIMNVGSILGGGAAASLYNSSNAVSLVLNAQGTSYFTGGSLCIGTTNPGSNLLAVEGSIASQKVICTLANPFPDYVFFPGYALPSLDSVSDFIHTYHHLAGVPSADSVAKNGLDLGGNQAVLLKKIEELTLYVIGQQKELEALKEQNQRLEERINGHN